MDSSYKSGLIRRLESLRDMDIVCDSSGRFIGTKEWFEAVKELAGEAADALREKESTNV